MPEYIVSRSSGKTPPCNGAVLHKSTFMDYFMGLKGVYDEGYYTIKAKNLDDLFSKLEEEFDESIIIRKSPRIFVDDDDNVPRIEVEIYDDWRE